MISAERKIWETAIKLIKSHGGEAPEIAREKANASRHYLEGFTTREWCQIAQTASELLRLEPEEKEYLN